MNKRKSNQPRSVLSVCCMYVPATNSILGGGKIKTIENEIKATKITLSVVCHSDF